MQAVPFVPPEVWGDAPPCIFVTQPRRVAAVTLAQRVAFERGEAAGEFGTVAAPRGDFVEEDIAVGDPDAVVAEAGFGEC